MQYEKSDELIVVMIVEPVIHRTCAAGCRGRLCGDKTLLSKGVLALERVKKCQHNNINRKKKHVRKVAPERK